jgi:hypothetical protein
MKQPYLKETSINKHNYTEVSGVNHAHDTGLPGFQDKTYSAKENTCEQTYSNKYRDDTVMLDIFGALNY